MKAIKLTAMAILLLVPAVLSGCSLLGLGGPPPLCDDPAVASYVQKVTTNYTTVTQAFNRIGELYSRVQNDSTLVSDPIWQSSVNDEVQTITGANQQIQSLSSPRKELGVFHHLLIGAFQNYADGAKALQAGVTAKDFQQIASAIATLQQGDSKLSGARDELKSVLGSCPGFPSS